VPDADGDGVYEHSPEHATLIERDTYGLLLMLSILTDSEGDDWPSTARLFRLARPSDGYANTATSSVVALTCTCAFAAYAAPRPTLLVYTAFGADERPFESAYDDVSTPI
jgi:hypothetical protein